MDGLNRRQYSAEGLRERTGCPASFFRHLLRHCEIGIGSRLCVAENNELRLTCFLRSLGIETSPYLIGTPAANHTNAASVCGEAGSTGPPPRKLDFDMAIVRDHQATNGSLIGPLALQATAELLSILRPGGRLLFLHERQAAASVLVHRAYDGNRSPRHSSDCYQRHLSCFPGQRHVAEHQYGLLTRLVGRWRGASQLICMESITIRIPDYRMPRAQWLEIARGAAAAITGPCCPAAAGASAPNEMDRRAA